MGAHSKRLDISILLSFVCLSFFMMPLVFFIFFEIKLVQEHPTNVTEWVQVCINSAVVEAPHLLIARFEDSISFKISLSNSNT